ncbi:sentrin-specific protease 7 isoform X2 [Cheilinus undulatus]|uniref:sentrin-specific protease 7 isoform X2 n=1 Tax=Cheilinus undulatus TaxID=241271 RepID=UPI001BD4C5FB|nr:sentrin-specific protease 7 isoform X2 [Cheilinus undulatus]
MMERRKALTLPLTVDKDNLMENPLKIPVQSLSSNCGKLERQVSWTAFAGYKLRQWDSPHKNGSKLFENSIAAMERRKPRIILKDVLKTELGKDHLEKMKRRRKLEIYEPQSSVRRESGHSKEKPLASRETRSFQKSEVRTPKNNILTPKCNKKTPPSSSQRSRVSRRSQKADGEEDGDENREIEGVMKSTDNGEDEKFAEVVDCGLSLSWKPSENRETCDEFSPASIKDRLTDPEKEGQHSLRRKRKEPLTQCNGTTSPKRHRESVLRLSGEDGRNRGMGSTQIRAEEESTESRDLESVDQTIVQFTVGGEDPSEVVPPIVTCNLEAGDILATTNQDSATKTKPSEPIVLSSDDEEGNEVRQRRSSTVHTLVSMKDSVMQRQTSKEAVMKQQEDSELPGMPDMQVLSVIVDDPPGSVSVTPPHGLSLMNVSFSTLHCGGYMGKSNGDVMITEHNIILPLTDTSEQVELMLMFKRDDLKRYSIWEHQELEVEGLYFSDGEDPFPAAFLLFCVSENSASDIQRDLVRLGVKQDGNGNSGKASPFILITLRDPLEGIKEALLRSFLEMDCLKGLTDLKPVVPQSIESFTDDFQTPALTLDESIELISRTGRDSYLLSLLGLESNDPGLNTDRDVSHCDVAESIAQVIQLEDSSQKEEAPELDTVADSITGTELKPEEEQKDPEPASPSDKKKENTTPVYTLCHRRTTGSYSVSLCRPDPSWTKYKHQGIARRLIQFPPPPLKGGITVTMEDLQCLDSGQFLNDVIIDFYLKYLLQNSSEALAERCHIFSSFFYKQLTRRDNASEGVTNDTCQRQRRHQRVKTWTRHVDIFKKDFLFVPVNQEAHWYLVVICFPGLEEPKLEAWNSLNTNNGSSNGVAGELQDQEQAHGSKSLNENNTENPPTPGSNDTKDTGTEKAPEESTKDQPPGPVDCTEKTCQKKTVCKRPCILIMDSLKLSLHERVFKLLREYLQSEWEVRRGSSREFGPDQMQSSHCKVPLQDNSSDCGLYLLQYVESFLKDPVVHFDLPLHLERWFPRQQVRRKRDDIRDLILHLFRKQNLNANR